METEQKAPGVETLMGVKGECCCNKQQRPRTTTKEPSFVSLFFFLQYVYAECQTEREIVVIAKNGKRMLWIFVNCIVDDEMELFPALTMLAGASIVASITLHVSE